MKIKIKGIYHERTEDSPFIGALICSINCNFNCKNCFNAKLKQSEIQEIEDAKIIEIVLSNPFNKGIILGGLEWTEQSVEMLELIKKSLNNNLQIMLYTGHNEEYFNKKYPNLLKQPIYIKFGQYIEELKTNNNWYYGVKLASSNQYIKFYGK